MELLRVFSAASLCALACYLILTMRVRPRLDTPVRKVCWHCLALHDESGEWCPACKSALFPDGVTWVYYQQEVDQIPERLK